MLEKSELMVRCLIFLFVYAGNGVPEVLLGRQWLKNKRLLVDMPLLLLTLGY